MARIYLQEQNPIYDECRFDVVAITGDVIDIIKDAWRVNGQSDR
jgi:Holliday junction resolvase-like predicted endonuclease